MNQGPPKSQFWGARPGPLLIRGDQYQSWGVKQAVWKTYKWPIPFWFPLAISRPEPPSAGFPLGARTESPKTCACHVGRLGDPEHVARSLEG